MLSFLVDADGHKRGPTSRHAVGTEIQRDCNFKAHVYHFSYPLGFISSRGSILSSQLPYNLLIFRALSHHQAQVQDHLQQQPTQPNALNIARYRKAVYSALWVQLALVVCYLPFYTVETVISLSKERFPNFIVIRRMTVVLVFFNSTLNPFLYCWKIGQVRLAVKQTIRQAICYA